jgi:RNA polymerase sigma-70 factor (ECF subfamily)
MNALALAWIAPSGVLGANSATAMDEAVVPDDAGLVTEARAGRDDAFAELVRRHKQRVFAAASRYARDDHQVDDIAQEIFVRAYRNLGQFRGDAPFEHWLSKIIVSACYDFLRKERRVREQVSLDAAVREFPDETAECAIAAGRAREFLAWGMRKLSAADQLILTLCELEERPVREVARLTDWSESNVKVRAFRARQNLKKILETSHER